LTASVLAERMVTSVPASMVSVPSGHDTSSAPSMLAIATPWSPAPPGRYTSTALGELPPAPASLPTPIVCCPPCSTKATLAWSLSSKISRCPARLR
jgi:hypothetical protein